MSTFTVCIEVPENLKTLGFTTEAIQKQAPILLVLKSYRDGAISSGKAAEILDLSRVEFLELLGKEKIPFLTSDSVPPAGLG